MKWLIIVVSLMLSGCNSGIALAIEIPRLADAIYKAENSKVHPYGIMKKYKVTTPRQACINTIKHAIRDAKCYERMTDREFIEFLGNRYAPRHVANDPTDLNKNWIKNVTRFYERG